MEAAATNNSYYCRGFISVILALALSFTGCKVIVSFGVHKDWAIHSPNIYHPDCKTSAEIKFEENFKK